MDKSKKDQDSLSNIKINIENMSCQTCAKSIEKILNKKHAIEEVNVNFVGEIAHIKYDPEQTDIEQIKKWIKKAGFDSSIFEAYTEDPSPPLANIIEDSSTHTNNSDNNSHINQANKKNWFKVPRKWQALGLFISFIVFFINMAGMMFGLSSQWLLPFWLQFIFATLTQLLFATVFYRRAWTAIKNRMANMDVLVVMGTLTIWIYSSFVWLSEYVLTNTNSGLNAVHHIYFEAGVMILSFISLGKYIENRTKKSSLNSIEMMLSLTPSIVEKQSEIGEFYQIELKDVAIADVLRGKQGSRIATDGMVIDGECWCSESHLTGEYKPVLKKIGDKVLAGAIVKNGSIEYRVHAKGADTKLGDMISALNEAQNSKAPIARMADKVSAIFVPVVLLIALITLFITYHYTGSVEIAILHAVSVLVVSCPCALGLATPSAIMVGMGLAAKHGILFKNAETLENAGKINKVVFDKTGTLTEGVPTLVAHMLMDKSLRYNEVLQLAASVEAHASHPFASALVKSAKKERIKLIPTTDINVSIGQGIEGLVSGIGLVKVGNMDWLNVTLPDDIAANIPKVLQTSSLVAVTVNDIPLGLFAFSDKIRTDARKTVSKLRISNIDVILMSGDRAETVKYVSEQLGIEEAYANMTPREKAEEVQVLQAKNNHVAMLGDGVNDAPAMATADISFSMSNGTAITKNSADACLTVNSTANIVDAIKIAKNTLRHIKQNLFFAFFYNCIAIPLAAFGYLNPMIAALLMSLSSISVLINALRLNTYH